MNIRLVNLFIVALLSFVLSPTTLASVGKVIIAKGETYALDTANSSRPLKRRSEVMEGDTLITGPDSEIHIRFEDNAVLALRADSQLKISEYHSSESGSEEKVLMELLSGGFRTITGTFGKSDSDAYEIRTPNASIGIRGTNYEALLNSGRLLVGVYQGGVRLENQFGSINLGLDSAFSFAQVGSATQAIEGLVEPPQELQTPLATSLNEQAEPNDESGDEQTANLKNEDEDLLVENLFDDKQTITESEEVELAEFDDPTLTGIEEKDTAQSAVEIINETTDLTAYADVRLTQEQIKTLMDGTAKKGFVVVNEDAQGFKAAVYELPVSYSGSSFTPNEALEFRITVSGGDSDVTYNISLAASSTVNLISEIQTQITSQTNGNSSLTIPEVLSAEVIGGKLYFTAYINGSGTQISFSKVSGADWTSAAIALGLCDGAEFACNDGFSDGTLSINQYNTATHFGYMVKGEKGPVFVNFENESLTALDGGYRTPDNVFRGNSNATLTNFSAVDIRGDGTDAIEWGYWNTSAANAAVLLKDPSDLSIGESIESPFFFVTAPPAKNANLVGTKSISTIVDWHATTSTATGVLSHNSTAATLTSTLSVDFGNAEAVGTLDFAANDSSWDWFVEFYGDVKGSQFFSDYGYGTLSKADLTNDLDVVGNVNGLFTDVSASSLGFVGGFNLQTTDDQHQAQGVFVIKE